MTMLYEQLKQIEDFDYAPSAPIVKLHQERLYAHPFTRERYVSKRSGTLYSILNYHVIVCNKVKFVELNQRIPFER